MYLWMQKAVDQHFKQHDQAKSRGEIRARQDAEAQLSTRGQVLQRQPPPFSVSPKEPISFKEMSGVSVHF